MSEPLHGLRVVDFSFGIACAYCAKLLGDAGADVVKVEPLEGDVGRFPRPNRSPDMGAGFLNTNRNKRSIAIDMATAEGQALIRELAAQADVLVESFAPRVIPALGLDYDTLRQANPRLVVASVSNFGQTGPYRDYKLSEIVLYAMGGTMQATGTSDREPVKLALTAEQFFCGGVSATATMGAHLGSLVDGEGQHLDIALFDAVIAVRNARPPAPYTQEPHESSAPACSHGHHFSVVLKRLNVPLYTSSM